MPLRGGQQPDWMQGLAPMPAAPAAAQMPGLLQMAQAAMGDGGGSFRGGGGGAFEAPSPTIGAAPAFQESGAPGIWPSIFNSGKPSGWFTLNDYYKGQPDEGAPSAEGEREGRGGRPGGNSSKGRVPDIYQGGAGMASTNDWRLLPPQYRDPNYFQVNGQIIDRRLASQQLSPASNFVMGQEGAVNTAPGGLNVYSGGKGGFPRTFFTGNTYAAGGFPGQLGGHSQWWHGGG